MSVEAVRLQNFMAFVDTGWVNLRPITLLYGRNSTGKSAIIRAIRLLRQSLNTSLEEDALRFYSPNGLDQGAFKNTINQRRLSEGEPDKVDPLQRSLYFHFRLANMDIAYELWQEYLKKSGRSDQQYDDDIVNMLDIGLEFGYGQLDGSGPQKTELLSFQITIPRDNGEEDEDLLVFLAVRSRFFERSDDSSEEKWGWTDNWFFSSEIFEQNEEHIWQSCIVERIGFLPQISVLDKSELANLEPNSEFENIQNILGKIHEEIGNFLENISYLGPIRPDPQRLYVFNQEKMDRWEQMGWGQFLKFLSGDEANDAIKSYVGKWLHYLKIGNGIDLNKSHADSLGFWSSLTVEKSTLFDDESDSKLENDQEQKESNFSIFANIKDIGFGASQVLPIVIESLLSKDNSIVIIEQPELHLHPEAQANLADLFIYSILTKLATRGNLRFLIETHSEHVLIRLQKRIAQAYKFALCSRLGSTSEIKDICEERENNDKFYELIEDIDTNMLPQTSNDRNIITELQSSSLQIIHVCERENNNVEHISVDSMGQPINPSREFEEFFDRDYIDSTDLALTIGEILSLEKADENRN